VWPTGGTYPLVLWERDGALTYCLEATAITAGAAITWLRDGLGLIRTPADADRLAASVPDAGGVWAVPALQGLGTPYFDSTARAVVGGLSRGTTRAHVVRAMLEGIAWRCREAFDALVADAPRRPDALRANGGAARSDVLLQAEADALGIPVERATVLEAAVLGAAHLAGLATGVWSGTAELRERRTVQRVFEPRIGDDERETRFAAWRRHVGAARDEA
jgi:glycerol kinase